LENLRHEALPAEISKWAPAAEDQAEFPRINFLQNGTVAFAPIF
jgi:hypothetical protein